jgi:hypothetical protein
MIGTLNRVKEIVKTRRKPVVKNVVGKAGTDFNVYVQMVEKKAFELYEKRGFQHGHDMEDWFAAEELIEDELCK